MGDTDLWDHAPGHRLVIMPTPDIQAISECASSICQSLDPVHSSSTASAIVLASCLFPLAHSARLSSSVVHYTLLNDLQYSQESVFRSRSSPQPSNASKAFTSWCAWAILTPCQPQVSSAAHPASLRV